MKQQSKIITVKYVKKGSSKYKGVTRVGRRWQAQIMVNQKNLYLGMHATEEEAAHAYDLAALRWHGTEACLNFPREDYV